MTNKQASKKPRAPTLRRARWTGPVIGNDEDVIARAKLAIESHSHFAGRGHLFELGLRDNVLIVRGRVPTYYLKQMLQTALKNVEGVRSIDNQVTVDISQAAGD